MQSINGNRDFFLSKMETIFIKFESVKIVIFTTGMAALQNKFK